MKKNKRIPVGYRKMRWNEIIRKGDIRVPKNISPFLTSNDGKRISNTKAKEMGCFYARRKKGCKKLLTVY